MENERRWASAASSSRAGEGGRGRRAKGWVGGAIALSVVVAASPARAQSGPPTETEPSSTTTLAIQGGFSGLSRTMEAEAATQGGLVAGVGIHLTPDETVGPTARLAFDHAFGQTGHHHLRAGFHVYGFSESPTSTTCSSCTLLVPEIGYRFVGASGFVFEIAEPLGRLNLTRIPSDGVTDSWASDGDDGFLVTVLVGYSHAL